LYYIPLKQYQNDFDYIPLKLPKPFYYIPLKQYQNDFDYIPLKQYQNDL
jgi:hypothetical protein